MSYSWLAVALMSSGTLVVFLILGLFATGRRYLRQPGPDRGIGFAQARVGCEHLLHSLALSLRDIDKKEQNVVGCLRGGDWSDEKRRQDIEALLREADVPSLWRSFGTYSSLAEHDPEQARIRLEELQSRVEKVSESLEEAEKACRKADPGLPYR